jgi:hypothetical protein
MNLPETIITSDGPSIDGAGPQLLTELLATLEERLREARAPFDEIMGRGLSRESVQEKLNSIGLTPPEELISWFGWHDTLESARPPWIFPNLFQMPLASLVQIYPIEVEVGTHPPTWFNIAGDSNGNAVSCEKDPSQPPLVRALLHDEGGLDFSQDGRQVVSLCTPVAWWIEALDRGVYTWDLNLGAWRTDRSLLPEIQRHTFLV